MAFVFLILVFFTDQQGLSDKHSLLSFFSFCMSCMHVIDDQKLFRAYVSFNILSCHLYIKFLILDFMEIEHHYFSHSLMIAKVTRNLYMGLYLNKTVDRPW